MQAAGRNCQQSYSVVKLVPNKTKWPGKMSTLVQSWQMCHRFNTCSGKELIAWPCKHGLKPLSKEVISSRGEATAIVLLNSHDIPIKLLLIHYSMLLD